MGPRGLEKMYADIIHLSKWMWLPPFERRASAATFQLRNERGIMRISAHPKAEKPEEQHHNAQYAHTQFLLACPGASLNYGD
jgi:hypothetical protein